MNNNINKIKIILTVICLILVLVMLFIKMPSKNNKLIITEKTWGEKATATDYTKEYEIKINNKIKINNIWNSEITIEILSITNDTVTIKTSEPMNLTNENNTINLNSRKTKFEIKKNSTITLSTLTMDAGASYEIEFK